MSELHDYIQEDLDAFGLWEYATDWEETWTFIPVPGALPKLIVLYSHQDSETKVIAQVVANGPEQVHILNSVYKVLDGGFNLYDAENGNVDNATDIIKRLRDGERVNFFRCTDEPEAEDGDFVTCTDHESRDEDQPCFWRLDPAQDKLIEGGK